MVNQENLQEKLKMIRFIGDIHGDKDTYLQLIDGVERSVQIGDMGTNYKFLEGVDGSHHKFFGGNHENYETIHECPGHLGDFGEITGSDHKIFFVRGAWSIDGLGRSPELASSLTCEQLSHVQRINAIEAYDKLRPDILVSHEGPLHMLWRMVDSPPYTQTWTNHMLDNMHYIHKPKIHIFGHYHRDLDEVVDGCRYICLTGWLPWSGATQKFFDL